MGEWKGMIITCDRCGKEHRRALLGEKVLDGGFTRADEFEDMPSSWKYRHDIGWLCPACSREYERLARAFMEGGVDAHITDQEEVV